VEKGTVRKQTTMVSHEASIESETKRRKRWCIWNKDQSFDWV